MKRKIRIEASFSGVLPVASYANLKPGFCASAEFEQDFNTEEEYKICIESQQQELQSICYQNFEREAEKARIQKITEDLKNFRFYEVDGEKYPSVTSIIGYDKNWFNITDDELRQLSAQGNLIDAEWKHLVKTGKYIPNSELLECTAWRHLLKNGSKQLSLDGWNILGFLEKYPLKNMEVGNIVINKKQKYAGTPDIICIYDGVKTLVDIKRTKSETENFMQMAAYAKCLGMEDVKQMMIIPMKPEADGGTKQGFSKPTISDQIDRYYELFLYKRNQVKEIYGV